MKLKTSFWGMDREKQNSKFLNMLFFLSLIGMLNTVIFMFTKGYFMMIVNLLPLLLYGTALKSYEKYKEVILDDGRKSKTKRNL